MDDKELLKLVAKAIGIPLEWTELDVPRTTGWKEWNPLTRDSDAFRLAVKLKLQVLTGQGPDGDITWVRPPEELDLEGPSERHGSDACAATRRAIVRAAALMAD
jgi:hypothetical protein